MQNQGAPAGLPDGDLAATNGKVKTTAAHTSEAYGLDDAHREWGGVSHCLSSCKWTQAARGNSCGEAAAQNSGKRRRSFCYPSAFTCLSALRRVSRLKLRPSCLITSAKSASRFPRSRSAGIFRSTSTTASRSSGDRCGVGADGEVGVGFGAELVIAPVSVPASSGQVSSTSTRLIVTSSYKTAGFRLWTNSGSKSSPVVWSFRHRHSSGSMATLLPSPTENPLALTVPSSSRRCSSLHVVRVSGHCVKITARDALRRGSDISGCARGA